MRIGLIVAAAVLTAATPVWPQRGGGLDRLMEMDGNGDGAITRAEARTARGAMFSRLDADGDGHLSQSERSSAGAGARMLNQIPDADGDGRISRDEMMAAPFRGFDRLDTNGDGIVSAAEIEAARSRAR